MAEMYVSLIPVPSRRILPADGLFVKALSEGSRVFPYPGPFFTGECPRRQVGFSRWRGPRKGKYAALFR
jgi:hypothetical protein